MSVITSYASGLSGATCGSFSQSRGLQNHLALLLRTLLAFALVFFPSSWISHGAESSAPPPSPSQLEGTNFQQLVRSCLQIQEQLQATQLAVEQGRQETKAAAVQNAEALSKGLQVLQETFSAQRARDLEVRQRSDRIMLIVAGTFAAMGFLTLLLITYFQWRMSKGLAEISAVLPAALELGGGSALAALGPAEQSRLRLLGTMEQLDKRIQEFKGALSPGDNGDLALGFDHGTPATGAEPAQANERARIALLLNQAHSMMKLDKPEAALAYFDSVLALNPDHTEALVRRGAALERLHRLNEAIECYDRAIAVDSSMTAAYLHKGGLCNRLERFREALQCYETALRTHDQRGS
jgi:tetratricopeptide (TPR) repeat protein